MLWEAAKRASKYGVWMGLGLCLYTTAMWLTALDTTYLAIGQYLDMAIILWPIGVTLWAIRAEAAGSRLTLGRRIGVAIAIGAVSFVIYDPFLWLYHHVINPSWFDAVVRLREQQLAAASAPAEEIARMIEAMRRSSTAQAGLFRLTAVVASVVILPGLIALLSLLLVRNKPIHPGTASDA